jgi:hypothetical protein
MNEQSPSEQVVIWDEESVWRASYCAVIPQEDGSFREITYGRELFSNCWTSPELPSFNRRALALIRLGIQPEDRVLIIGGAFGYLAERLMANGVQNVWSLEPSEWIHSQPSEFGINVPMLKGYFKEGPELESMLNEQAGGTHFKWIITDDVFTSLEDHAAIEIANLAEEHLEPSGTVVHFVWVDEAPNFNIKPISEWRNLIPHQIFLSACRDGED